MALTVVNPSTADLSGNFKEVYGDSLKDLLPMGVQLIKKIPFTEATKVGNKFHQPVVVKSEHGFTYSASGAGAFALGAFASLQTQDAQVDGVNLVLQSNIDYESAARGSVSKAAFAEVTGLKVKHMTANTRKRLEIAAWYGQSGLGTINAVATVSATQTKLTLTQANFAPLIWAGSAGARLTITTSGLALVGAASGNYTVARVDVSDGNRFVWVNSSSGDATTLQGITPNDTHRIYWDTSYSTTDAVHNDMLGVHGQLTTSGVVFNIDNTVYDQWAPNTYAVGGALNYKGINDAVAQAVSRGLDEDAEVFVSYRTFGNVMSDLSALRIIDSSYDPKKAVAGHEAVEFHGLNGKVSITPSGYVKQGFAYCLPTKDMVRVGASDLSFATPGSKGGDIFFQLPSNAGFGLRAYSHQGVALLAPSKAVVLTGIVNT